MGERSNRLLKRLYRTGDYLYFNLDAALLLFDPISRCEKNGACLSNSGLGSPVKPKIISRGSVPSSMRRYSGMHMPSFYYRAQYKMIWTELTTYLNMTPRYAQATAPFRSVQRAVHRVTSQKAAAPTAFLNGGGSTPDCQYESPASPPCYWLIPPAYIDVKRSHVTDGDPAIVYYNLFDL